MLPTKLPSPQLLRLILCTTTTCLHPIIFNRADNMRLGQVHHTLPLLFQLLHHLFTQFEYFRFQTLHQHFHILILLHVAYLRVLLEAEFKVSTLSKHYQQSGAVLSDNFCFLQPKFLVDTLEILRQRACTFVADTKQALDLPVAF